MRLLLLLLAVWLLPPPVRAQERSLVSIRGTVVDSVTRRPLREATVSLLSARDSSFLQFTITGGAGTFFFRNVPRGAYRLLVTYLGYHSASRRIELTSGQPTADIDTLTLFPVVTTLREVVVEGEKAPVTLRQDTLEFNAGSFKTRPNAQVEDLLRKLPGLEVSRDGTVKAQGEEVKRILVDGKPFFGDDPKVATRNLPAEIIEKVQVFDQQSDQSAFSGFSDGNREKTINLTTRKDKRKGIFGQESLGAGTDGRYQGRLNLHRFNNGQQLSLIGSGNNLNQPTFTVQDMFSFGAGQPGGNTGGSGSGGNAGNTPGNATGSGGVVLVTPDRGSGNTGSSGNGTPDNITETRAGGVNFRDSRGTKADFSGSYFLNYASTNTEQQRYRQNILPDTAYLNTGNNQSESRSLNHRFNFRLEYRFDSLTTLRLSPSVSLQHSVYSAATDTRTSTLRGNPLNRSLSAYTRSGDGFSGSNQALLLRKFRQRGRTFSLGLNSSLGGQPSEGSNQSENTFYPSGTDQPESRLLNQHTRQRVRNRTHTLTASYTEPLSLRQSLEFYYSYSHTRNTSARSVADYNEASGAYDRFNPRLSNQFAGTFATQRAGLAFQQRRLKYTYSFGLDLQFSGLRTDNQTSDSLLNRRFTNWLPTAMFTYNFSASRTLRIQYRTQLNAPTISQLQPVPDYTNPLNIQQGNPNLRPEYIHSVSAVYNAFQSSRSRSLFATLGLVRTDHQITNATTVSPTGTQLTRPVNTNGNYALNGFAALGRPLAWLKSNLNLTTQASYAQGFSLVNEQANRTRRLTLSQGASLQSNFSQELEFSVGGNLQYQRAAYSLEGQATTAFFYQTLTFDLYYQLPGRLVFTTDFTYTHNAGQSAGYNQRFSLWNVSLARQLFRNRQGELKLQVYDLLNQNRSVVRNVGDTYVEDVRSRVLRQYWLLSFTYHLRRFGGKSTARG